MRPALRASRAGMLSLAICLPIAACGSSARGLLSSGQAQTLNGRLDKISQALAASKCRQAEAAAGAFESDVANLPDGVNATLHQNLIQGASTIAKLVPKDCAAASAPSTTPQTTTLTSPTTATVTPASSSSSTTTTATTPPPAPPATTTTTSTTGGAGAGGGPQSSSSTTTNSGGVGPGGGSGGGNGDGSGG